MSGYSPRLTLRDFYKSKSLHKSLKRAYGVALFGSKFLTIDQTNFKFDFRFLISGIFTTN